MKNKPILSYLLWLFVAFLSVVYFMTQDKTREIEAISETNSVTEKVSTELLKVVELEIEYKTFLKGNDDRYLNILDGVKQHHFLLDSINGKIKWKELENTFDSLKTWSYKPAKSVLDYKDYSSKKMAIIHQNLFYKLYQVFLMEQRYRMGDLLLEGQRAILTNLDSTFCIEYNHYETYSSVSSASLVRDTENYCQSFDFDKSDTVIFEVITEFYRKETEVKKYRIIAKNKKGVKINSLFDYEEIAPTK